MALTARGVGGWVPVSWIGGRGVWVAWGDIARPLSPKSVRGDRFKFIKEYGVLGLWGGVLLGGGDRDGM